MNHWYIVAQFTVDVLFVADQKGSSDDKFNKLKGMYGKLREEHIQLLRTVSVMLIYKASQAMLREEIVLRLYIVCRVLINLESRQPVEG